MPDEPLTPERDAIEPTPQGTSDPVQGGSPAPSGGQDTVPKDRYVASSQEAIRQKQRADAAEAQLQQLQQVQSQWAAAPPPQPAPQPAPAPAVTYDNEYFEPGERQRLKEAQESYDWEAVQKINDARSERRENLKVARGVALLAQASQIQQKQGSLVNRVQSHPEWNNPQIRPQLLGRAQQILNDPNYSYLDGNQWAAVNEAVNEWRGQYSGQLQAAQTEANQDAYVDTSTTGGATSSPVTAEADYRSLLNANEKKAATGQWWKQSKGLRDDDAAMRSYWDSLGEAEQKRRKQAGAAPQGRPDKMVRL